MVTNAAMWGMLSARLSVPVPSLQALLKAGLRESGGKGRGEWFSSAIG